MEQVKRNIASLIVMFIAVIILPNVAFAAEQDGVIMILLIRRNGQKCPDWSG